MELFLKNPLQGKGFSISCRMSSLPAGPWGPECSAVLSRPLCPFSSFGPGVPGCPSLPGRPGRIHRTEAVAGHVSATPVPRQKAEMQFRAKMSFMLRAVIFKAIAAVWYSKQQTFMHNLQVYSSSQSLVRA